MKYAKIHLDPICRRPSTPSRSKGEEEKSSSPVANVVAEMVQFVRNYG